MKLLIFAILTLVVFNARAENIAFDARLKEAQAKSISIIRHWHSVPTTENPAYSPTPWQTQWHLNRNLTCDLSASNHRRNSDLQYICDSRKALKKVELAINE